MKDPRFNGCCLEFMRKIYIFGGQNNQLKTTENIEVFDPIQEVWKLL